MTHIVYEVQNYVNIVRLKSSLKLTPRHKTSVWWERLPRTNLKQMQNDCNLSTFLIDPVIFGRGN